MASDRRGRFGWRPSDAYLGTSLGLVRKGPGFHEKARSTAASCNPLVTQAKLKTQYINSNLLILLVGRAGIESATT